MLGLPWSALFVVRLLDVLALVVTQRTQQHPHPVVAQHRVLVLPRHQQQTQTHTTSAPSLLPTTAITFTGTTTANVTDGLTERAALSSVAPFGSSHEVQAFGKSFPIATTTTVTTYDQNSLGGTIPTELGLLKATTILNLAAYPENVGRINGTIPTELGLLTRLTWLKLVSETLTGTIPTELGLMTALACISLGFAGLPRTIPTELAQMKKLTNLTLPDSELTGTIPTELGRMTVLVALNLSKNHLLG